MSKTPRLGKIDWINAGFRALCKGGANAIAIEPIARELKSTKGSFYWHFKDLAALKSAMLEHYKTAGTEAIIIIANQKLTPLESLLFTIRSALSPPNNDIGGRDAELAVRDWARWDKEAQEKISKIDDARIGFLRAKLIEIGHSEIDADKRANILYATYLGAINMRAAGKEISIETMTEYMVSTIRI